MDRDAVRPAVEGLTGLVVAGLRWHQRDLVRGNVRGVHEQQVDPATQLGGQCVVEVAAVGVAAHPGEVAARARHRDGVDVGGVHDHTGYRDGDRHPDGAGTAAQIDDDRTRPGDGNGAGPVGGYRDGPVDEERGASPRDEHAGVDLDAQAAEPRPAEDHLKRDALHAPGDEPVQLLRTGRLGDQQLGLLLGEHAARRPKAIDRAGQQFHPNHRPPRLSTRVTLMDRLWDPFR